MEIQWLRSYGRRSAFGRRRHDGNRRVFLHHNIPDLQKPPKGKLPDSEIAEFTRPPSTSVLKSVMHWLDSLSTKLQTEEPTGNDVTVSESSERKALKDLAYVLMNTNNFKL